MQFQSKNLNKVRALLYTIWKYFFKEYSEFSSVSPFWIWRENIYSRVDRFNRESIDSIFLQNVGNPIDSIAATRVMDQDEIWKPTDRDVKMATRHVNI